MFPVSRTMPFLLWCAWVWAAGPAQALTLGGIHLNEIRIDQPGADRDEFLELAGAPRASLDDLAYVVLGDGSGGSGVVEAVVSLDGERLGDRGLFVVAERSFTLGEVDLYATLNFENRDNVTHLLVQGFRGRLFDDLDEDDDGILDVLPWEAVLDSVALLETPAGGDRYYSGTRLGPSPVSGQVPAHVYRQFDGDGPWVMGAAWGEDSPGLPRLRPPGTGAPGSGGVLAVTAPPPWLWLAAGAALLLGLLGRGDSRSAGLQNGAGGG